MSAVYWAYQQLDGEFCDNCPHADAMSDPRDSGWHFKA
jgi:hypothetical protein